MISLFAILDTVSNTEGVTYQVFFGVLGVMLTVFVAVIFGIVNMNNTRFTALDTKLDKLVEAVNKLSNNSTLNFYAIKQKLGVTTPVPLEDEEVIKSENKKED
jgi:hypothetical protein